MHCCADAASCAPRPYTLFASSLRGLLSHARKPRAITATADSNEQSEPRLDSLPTELKVRIAELCAQKDNVLRTACRDSELRGWATPCHWASEGTLRPGSSLSKLSQTSRAWHRIAAPILYRVRIARHRFDGTLATLIGAIGALGALEELILTVSKKSGALDRLFGDSASAWPPISPPASLRNLLVTSHDFPAALTRFAAQLGQSVDHLRLFVLFSCLPRTSFVADEGTAFPNVRTLTIYGDLELTTTLVLAATSSVFPSLHKLEWNAGWLSNPLKQDQTLRTFLSQQTGAVRTLDASVELPLDHRASPYQIVDPGTARRLRVRYHACHDNLAPTYPHAIFLDPEAMEHEEMYELHDEVSMAADRARQMVDRAYAIGDRVQLERLAQAFRDLEFLHFEQNA